MTDESQAVPATEAAQDAAQPATDGGSKNEIAGQIKDALNGADNLSTPDKTPREQLRRDIEASLGKATEDQQTAKPATERARGPDGKFIPTPQEVAAQEAAKTPAEAAPSSAPPASWSKPLQEKWSTLPPDIQAEITKRETDVANGFAKYHSLRVHEPVLDFAAQIAPRLGISGPQLVHQWAQTQEALLDPARKAQAVQYIARQYGVDLAQPQAQQPQSQPQADPNAWVDPEVAALKQQLQELAGWKTAQEQREQQFMQNQAQQMQSAKMSAINQFGFEKGADGQPLRPHLETVMPDMAAGIARLKAANPQISDQEALQQAYDNAVWGNPETRKLVIEAQRASDERERTEKARQRAQAATRGAVSPASASPQGPPASAPLKGDIRDQMRQTLEQLTA